MSVLFVRPTGKQQYLFCSIILSKNGTETESANKASEMVRGVRYCYDYSILSMCSANVNSVDNFYWTPLHMAAHSGVRSVVQYLLDHGASLEAKSLTGATPIMKAIESCSLDVVQLLINRGAKVRTENMCSK